MGLFHGTPLERPVTCEYCRLPACVCPRDAAGTACPPHLQHPRVRREKRRGKWTTVVAHLRASPDPVDPASPGKPGDLKPLLKSLKTALGTGAGLDDTRPDAPELIIQGDHKDAVIAYLKARGYHPKPAGG